jgi:hypothetical protein
MAIIKAPPKHTKSVTVRARVEESVEWANVMGQTEGQSRGCLTTI